MKRRKRVAIVIPAYNEGQVIRNVIVNMRQTLKSENIDFKIVVVDDGSEDNSVDEAIKAGAHVIQHIINIGSGGATATGLSYAQQNKFDLAATIDADGQHDPTDVIKGIELIQRNHADLLIGSRLINSRGMAKSKMLGNRGLSIITYLLFGIHVTDSQSGLRIFSKEALENLKWRTSGYEFCSEMLWRAKRLGMRIQEYPIKAIYTEYSKSKGQNNWNALNIIKSLLERRILELFGE